METGKLLSGLTHDDIIRQERSLEIAGLDQELEIVIYEDESEEDFEDFGGSEDFDEESYLEPEALIETYNESVFEDQEHSGHGRHIAFIKRIANMTKWPELVEFGGAQALELFNNTEPLGADHIRNAFRSIKKSMTTGENGRLRINLVWHTDELDSTVNDWANYRIPKVGDLKTQAHVFLGFSAVSIALAEQEKSQMTQQSS